MAIRPPVKRKGKKFEIRLEQGERDAIRELCEQQRALLVKENPAADPDLARLYPPAYPDDPLRNLDFERMASDDLLAQRLAALDVVSQTAMATSLTEDQLLSWLGAINDARLVLGTRLQITEDTEAELGPSHPEVGAHNLYLFLTWLVGNIVEALNPG